MSLAHAHGHDEPRGEGERRDHAHRRGEPERVGGDAREHRADGVAQVAAFQAGRVDADLQFGTEAANLVGVLFQQFFDVRQHEHAALPADDGISDELGDDPRLAGGGGQHHRRVVIVLPEVNGIWWGIQSDGFESFAPVQEKIAAHFPGTTLLLPTLSKSNPSEIVIKYTDTA